MKTKLELKVSTGKKHFRVTHDGGRLLVEVKNNPQKGKANEEIIKNLKNIFDAEVRIVSGFTNKRKLVEIDLEKDNIFQKLKQQT